MAFLSCTCFPVLLHKSIYSVIPVYTQLRWKIKHRKRKPRWLPKAPSKLFQIPEHPFEPRDEKELRDDLLDEYYIKLNSLRKLFQDEIQQAKNLNASKVDQHEIDEKEFHMLLEENRKENERIKIIREETLAKLLQEKLLYLLQLEEEKKKEQGLIKMKVDDIVRQEKENRISYITQENLDSVIEHAIDNPIDINFAITVDGNVQWEGKPPPEFEEEIQRRISSHYKT